MRIIPYRKVSDLDALSREFMTGAEGETRLRSEVRFVVPSRIDRD